MAKIEMPSSSINSTGEPPKKQLKKVTTGKVTIKQESEIQKLAHNFLAEDLQTIREKLWTDYILPGIKNMVCSAVNIALFGVDRSRGNTGGYSQQRNSYSSYYANANQNRPPQNNYRPNRLDWSYAVHKGTGSITITWSNSNIVDGVPIAVILQYGHGTRNGGYVQGTDYINPAMKPIFDKIAQRAWEEVKRE